jgi:hypothetical protein
MKNFLWALLLLVALPLMAEETNVIKIIITINLTQPNPIVIVEPTNSPVSVTVTNILTDKTRLVAEISQMEKNIYELTNGMPTSFAGSTGPNTDWTLSHIGQIWEKYDRAITNLNSKKLELKKLK